MSSEVVLEARQVSKVYTLYQKPEDRLKQMLLPRLRRVAAPLLGRVMPSLKTTGPLYREFWALRDVSLSMRRGETVGIIGQNGSGKSTLLQIICGTLTPSSGSALTSGRVAALLELGAGFNPEFTGRENVYLNAAIHGLDRQEITRQMPAILEFAEIGDHIDQPVKTYSSGMYVRLAFAVIVNVDADILIIDEALAVGDAYFQQKCMRFLRRFQEQGSIFFVSHDTGAMMNFCDRILWLHEGRVKAEGDPKSICEDYLAFLYEKQNREKSALRGTAEPEVEPEQVPDATPEAMALPAAASTRSFGDGGAEICGYSLTDETGTAVVAVKGGETLDLTIAVRARRPLRSVICGFVVKDRLGQFIFGDNTYSTTMTSPIDLSPGQHASARFRFTMPSLSPGPYTMAVAVASGTTKDHIQHHWLHEALAFESHTAIDSGILIAIPMTEIELSAS